LEVTIIEIGVKGGILACGTGITASDMAYYLSKGWQEDEFEVSIKAKDVIL
jgi:diaminopimelate epimerase